VAREIESSGGKALVHIGDVADAAAVQAMGGYGRGAIRPHSISSSTMRRWRQEKPCCRDELANGVEVLDVNLDGDFIASKRASRCFGKRSRNYPSISGG